MGDYLTSLMNRIHHPEHQPNSGTLSIPLLPSKLWRMILPFTSLQCQMRIAPKSSSAMVWYSLPSRWGLQGTHTHLKQYSLSHMFIDSSSVLKNWVSTHLHNIHSMPHATDEFWRTFLRIQVWWIDGLALFAHTNGQISSHCSGRGRHHLFKRFFWEPLLVIQHSFKTCH